MSSQTTVSQVEVCGMPGRQGTEIREAVWTKAFKGFMNRVEES